MNTPVVRYSERDLAWEYDRRNPSPEPSELEWYLAHIDAGAGPIVELACGTGRLTIPLAQAGISVVGVDNAPAVIDLLSQKLEEETKSRVRLHCADMMTFPSDERFSAVLLPNNSLQYLGSVDRIAVCIRNTRRLISEEGLFLAFVICTDPRPLLEGNTHVVDWRDSPVVDRDSGLTVGSKFVSRISADGMAVVKERMYVVSRPGVADRHIAFETRSPILTRDEYVGVLTDAGWRVEASGGYDGSNLDGDWGPLCMIGRAR